MKKNTKQRIFDTAVDLFSRQGYAGTSIREIAYAAGIKESSVYNHYKNKEDILQSIFDYFREEITSRRPPEKEMLKIIDAISPAEVIKLIFLKYGQTENATIDKIAKIIFSQQFINQQASDFVLNAEIREPITYYENILAIMARANRIKECDFRAIAAELHYGFLGIIMEYSHVKKEGEYDKETVKKLIRHVDFVFEHVQIVNQT
ncbi:MAG TPA: TetR/AcrR family transcriptional regulator [Syntrophomonadaceae bacterium]|nr:TetR/AcrR family transcriptional regulator [Syntrophomonadaceae bacterium]